MLRLHVDVALTDEVIVTCPPGTPPEPLDRLFEIEAIRSIDLHRYRTRMNLRPGVVREVAAGHVVEVLRAAWGPASALVDDPGPRAFEAATDGPRRVAEAPEMARGHRLLTAVFEVRGVAEAISGDGIVLVRLGRLFGWAEREADVARALQTAGGTPGSTSSPV